MSTYSDRNTPNSDPHPKIDIMVYDETDFSYDSPQIQRLKIAYNKLAIDAIKESDDANKISDSIYNEWSPKFRSLCRVTKFRDIFLLLVGFGVILFSIFMGKTDSGFAPLNIEQVGIFLAGFALSA